MKPTKAVISVAFPHQLLLAITAVLRHRRADGLREDAPAVLFVWSHSDLSSEEAGEKQKVIEELVSQFPWIETRFLSRQENRSLLSKKTVKAKTFFLRERLDWDSYSQVFYAHDLSIDFVAQAVMQACPSAERICYGDPPGILYARDFYLSLMYPRGIKWSTLRAPVSFFRGIAARAAAWYRLPANDRVLTASTAVLMLPCDPSGTALRKTRLLIPPLHEVRAIRERMAAGLSLIKKPLSQLNDKLIDGSEKHLLLTSNLAESNISTPDQELCLYEKLVQRHVPSGGVVFIKPHAGSDIERLEVLNGRLADRNPTIILKGELRFVPIELLLDRLGVTSVVSVSSASLTISYLFEFSKIYQLDDDLIDKYVLASKHAWMKESNSMINFVLDRLPQWDGMSLLTEGYNSNTRGIR